MTCTSCGDKPKGSSKGFPRAVVEINNPESLVLLRKVVIPVSMGTEEDVPPAIGKYFNVLLQYEANGHIYLYSSDGIPTAIEANIPQEVLDRIDQLEIDVDLLETGLANETTAREAADSALSSSINSLSSSISAETAAREQADTTLQNNITAEATARANGDAALNTAITSEVTARQEADTNLQNQITQEAQARAAADTTINGAITAEASTRQTADAGLQSQIDAITASSDVKDIVGTKAELNNYDTSTLGNNDIIKVLQDESENDATTYYRWNATTQQFTLIGEEGPYYTKSQADTLLNAKQNTLTAGSNVQIVNDTISATDTTYTAGTGLALNGTQFSVDTTAIATQSDLTAGLATKQDTLTAGANIQINNNTISATDTTYSDFTGTDGTAAGTAGLVPAPAATDIDKFLKSDGTWAIAGGGGIKTLTTADYNYPVNNPTYINLGLFDPGIYFVDDNAMIYNGTNVNKYRSSHTFVVTGGDGDSTIRNIMVIYPAAGASSNEYKIRFFYTFTSSPDPWTARGNVLSADYITNNLTTNNANRVLSAAQGKTLKDLIDGLVISGAGAPTTSTVGTVGQLYEDTTNGKLYICTAIDTSVTPNTYTWEEVGAGGGGGPTVVQTTGTSTTDVMSQNATTSMIYADPSTKSKVQIGNGSNAVGDYALAIGRSAQVNNANGSVALGFNANVGSAHYWSVALGANSSTTSNGEVSFGGPGVSGLGYNNSNYRLLTNVYDPQSAHDAATKGYVDNSLLDKQDVLTAGDGISIADESGSLVISSTGGGADAFTTNEWNALWA